MTQVYDIQKETQFKYTNTGRHVESKSMKKCIMQTLIKRIYVDMAILMRDEVEFRPKKMTRDREGHYMITKGTIHQKDIGILNVYASNKRTAK